MEKQNLYVILLEKSVSNSTQHVIDQQALANVFSLVNLGSTIVFSVLDRPLLLLTSYD